MAVYPAKKWRSLKYEHVYLKPADDGLELFRGIQDYINFYNTIRRDTSQKRQTPFDSYTQLAA
jgi:putative transposase